MTDLPGTGQSYPFKKSLKLVAEIEGKYGGLHQIAERLLDKTLTLTAMIGILKIAYRHSGCGMAEDELGEFLLQQPCTELLTSFLLDILEPVDRLADAQFFPSAQFLTEMSRRFPDTKGDGI
jgi:hypothetical protein